MNNPHQSNCEETDPVKIASFLRQIAQDSHKRAMPLLFNPAVQKLDVSLRALTASSELQARAMQYVAENTPAATAVGMMDLSIEAEAFGASVRFSDDEVPTVVGQLIADEDDASTLNVPSVGDGRTAIAVEAVRLAKQRICDRPVFAGCIGPYSLAGRLMDVTEIMYLCYDDPDTVAIVLDKAADFLIEYCKAFRGAGADGVVLAEPLAGLISPDMNREFSCPYVRRIIDAVQTEDFAVIYHNCGNAVPGMLEDLFALNAAAYHFGNALDMRDVLAKAPADVICMGNVDPAGQFASGTPESIREAALSLLRDCGAAPNFILSSGCDIPPQAKWENIHAFFEAVGLHNQSHA